MNTRLRLLIIFLLLGAIMLPAANVSAHTTRIEFSGTDVCDPTTLAITRVVMAGQNLQAEWTQTCNDTTTIPQMTGITYLSGTSHFVGNSRTYLMQGTLRTESSEGGVWIGTWEVAAKSNTIIAIGHGEGIYEGLQFRYELEFGDAAQPFHGYIFDPGQ